MTAAALRLVDAARTDVGKVRSVNEDSYISRPEINLWAVADGMGGHENGQWASQQIAASLAGVTPTGEFLTDAGMVADAIHAANATIFNASQVNGKTMGSTVVALLVNGQQFAVLWAGDSRVYLLRDGELYRLTRDHTQVQEMVDRGLLAPEDAEHHPMSHVISRVVGVESALELDAIQDEAEVGDVFLLCSDGLYGRVQDDEIAAALRAARPTEATEALIQLCLSRGAPDNVTILTIACDQITQLSFAASEEPPVDE